MDLVELYKSMIKSIIKKYLEYARKVGLDYDDLFQEASMAVLRAKNTYKEKIDLTKKQDRALVVVAYSMFILLILKMIL